MTMNNLERPAGTQESVEERTASANLERARAILPALRSVHDVLENRSMMADPSVAKLLASSFTHEGVKVFGDFAEALKNAKEKSTE